MISYHTEAAHHAAFEKGAVYRYWQVDQRRVERHIVDLGTPWHAGESKEEKERCSLLMVKMQPSRTVKAATRKHGLASVPLLALHHRDRTQTASQYAGKLSWGI